jgi:hypothetical protein
MYFNPDSGAGLPPQQSQLRPLTIMQVVEEVFRIYRGAFLQFFLVSLVVMIPVTLLSDLFSTAISNYASRLVAGRPLEAIAPVLVLGVRVNPLLGTVMVGLLQTIFFYSIVTSMAAEGHLGRPVSLLASLGKAAKRMVGLTIAYFLGITVIFFVGFFASLLLSVLSRLPGLAFIGVVLSVSAIGYFSFLTFVLLTPTFVLEKNGPVVALGRTINLARQRIFAIFNVIFILALIVAIVSAILATIVVAFVPGDLNTAAGAAQLRQTVLPVQVVINVFTAPLAVIAITVLYYDIRVRAEQLDQAVRNAPIAGIHPSDLPTEPLPVKITRADLSNILLLTFLVSILLLFLQSTGRSGF